MKKRILLALTAVLALGLPITLLSLLALLNPYAIALSAEFSVTNGLPEPIEVTPMGVVRMATGEFHWQVVPQLAVRFLAAPPRRQVAIQVPPGHTVAIRGNFDDISLAAIAVDTASQPGQVLMIDEKAAIGGCCYAPTRRQILVSKESLRQGSRNLADTIAKAKATDRTLRWYSFVGLGLAVGVAFTLSLLAYLRASRRPGIAA